MERKLKTRVLKRDGYMCILCHSQQRLHVHHWRDSWGILPAKEGFSYDNFPYHNTRECDLVTLCGSCHSKLHSIRNSRDYTESPWWRMWEGTVREKFGGINKPILKGLNKNV